MCLCSLGHVLWLQEIQGVFVIFSLLQLITTYVISYNYRAFSPVTFNDGLMISIYVVMYKFYTPFYGTWTRYLDKLN